MISEHLNLMLLAGALKAFLTVETIDPADIQSYPQCPCSKRTVMLELVSQDGKWSVAIEKARFETGMIHSQGVVLIDVFTSCIDLFIRYYQLVVIVLFSDASTA